MKLSICTGGDKRLEEQRQRASVFLSQLEQRKAEMGKESSEGLIKENKEETRLEAPVDTRKQEGTDEIRTSPATHHEDTPQRLDAPVDFRRLYTALASPLGAYCSCGNRLNIPSGARQCAAIIPPPSSRFRFLTPSPSRCGRSALKRGRCCAIHEMEHTLKAAAHMVRLVDLQRSASEFARMGRERHTVSETIAATRKCIRALDQMAAFSREQQAVFSCQRMSGSLPIALWLRAPLTDMPSSGGTIRGVLAGNPRQAGCSGAIARRG